jgi:predicted unusual protein kinase regulating ubiquinone biosynthesis (AarF/ABC1/UbiB family)
MNSAPLGTTLLRRARLFGAGLAALRVRLARSPEVRERARAHAARRLGRLRGLPQKVGQLLSTREGGEAFAPLQDSAEPLPLEDLLPLAEATWGRPAGEVLAGIEPRGLAASLGQVHRARLHDGREVAIKLRFPGIEGALEADLTALGWLSAPVGDLRKGFDLAGYRRVLGESLAEELDYGLEAARQRRFRELGTSLGLVVPEVIDGLCGEGVLVSAWEEGATLEEALSWPEPDRVALADALARAFLELGLVHGVMHADPHPGNLRFRRGPRGPEVVLYDFGSVCELEGGRRLRLLELLLAAADPDSTTDPYPLFLALGFDPDLLEPLRPRLAAVTRVLFEPFGHAGRTRLDAWKVSERLADLLGEERMAFRMAGPPDLLLFLRSFTGLLGLLRRLDAPVALGRVLREVGARLRGELAGLEALPDAGPGAGLDTLARHLRVRVRRGGRDTVSMRLPARAVEELDELLDDELLERIAAEGVELAELLRAVRAGGYAPGELFRLEDPARSVEVSLE